MLTRLRILLRSLQQKRRLRRYRKLLTHVGSGVVIEGPLVLRNEGPIILDQDVRLRSTAAAPITLEAIAGAVIRIGQGSFINRGTILAGRERISIGRGVAIADQCVIYDTDWHPLPGSTDHNAIPTAPVTIEDNAWIGTRCIILKGVTIGEGTVVGAGSVVTRSLPPRCIAAGNPARVIRSLDHKG